YSHSRLSEVQEPHPQPSPRSSRGDYDVAHAISKRYSIVYYSFDMGEQEAKQVIRVNSTTLYLCVVPKKMPANLGVGIGLGE
ncbi:hypothetical protein IQ229_09185, partial [Nostoc cf. edaphicum LEGE 07299]|nr:hypothetical protein [Nostoc cf. edaphicum LEGE 07299]